jgi:hypothetical protein
MRITLNEADFRRLIRGVPVYHQTLMGEQIEIVLDHLGWEAILKAIEAVNRDWRPTAAE